MIRLALGAAFGAAFIKAIEYYPYFKHHRMPPQQLWAPWSNLFRPTRNVYLEWQAQHDMVGANGLPTPALDRAAIKAAPGNGMPALDTWPADYYRKGARS